jgi:hypothetical protein
VYSGHSTTLLPLWIVSCSKSVDPWTIFAEVLSITLLEAYYLEWFVISPLLKLEPANTCYDWNFGFVFRVKDTFYHEDGGSRILLNVRYNIPDDRNLESHCCEESGSDSTFWLKERNRLGVRTWLFTAWMPQILQVYSETVCELEAVWKELGHDLVWNSSKMCLEKLGKRMKESVKTAGSEQDGEAW